MLAVANRISFPSENCGKNYVMHTKFLFGFIQEKQLLGFPFSISGVMHIVSAKCRGIGEFDKKIVVS